MPRSKYDDKGNPRRIPSMFDTELDQDTNSNRNCEAKRKREIKEKQKFDENAQGLSKL